VKRVLLLFGGRSTEHQISCLSARSVLEVIDRDRYEVVAVGITRAGRWTLTDGVIEVAAGQQLPEVDEDGPTVALVGTRHGPTLVQVDDVDGGSAATSNLGPIDVAFPLLHGPWGEDGTVQGLLATVGVPYVGADVTASSIGIDKAVMKATFAARGLPQGGYLAVHRSRWEDDREGVRAELTATLPAPWFTKPVRQGSSIGISKVHHLDALDEAMDEGFSFDEVVLIEQGLEHARELEVGVLGDGEVDVSRPGEIVPSNEFYDFDAKYLAASDLRIPADVPAEVTDRIGELAREAYRAIGCRGLARVDLFLQPDGELLINEINTIPGFTPNSMFPRLWAAEGVSYTQLVERLLTDAQP
jgi:D-alanine-D-alanine ligase